jgi:hypothetical protein
MEFCSWASEAISEASGGLNRIRPPYRIKGAL